MIQIDDEFELTLNHPMTKADFDKITDSEMENTDKVVFQTPKGKNVEFIKIETTRNVSGRNPVDKFICEKCGFMIDGWTAFNYEDETDDRFDYEFAFKFCPECGRRVEMGGVKCENCKKQ